MSVLISFNHSTPKTPVTRNDLGDLIYMLSYTLFCVKFRCRGSSGSKLKLSYAVKLAVPENYTLEPKIMTPSCVQPEL